MITKGRYQTKRTKNFVLLPKYEIIDTDRTTLGSRFVAATDTEKKADLVANALNFSFSPSAFGYKLVGY